MHLEYFPNKPWEQHPRNLEKLDKSNNYVCETKIDGWRMILIISPKKIEYISRHNKSFTDSIEENIKKEAKILQTIFPDKTQIDAEWLSRRSCSKEYNLTPKLFLLDVMRYGERWSFAEKYKNRVKWLDCIPFKELKLKSIAKPSEAQAGEFEKFFEEQKKITFSEGVVLKHKDSMLIADRKESIKNPLWVKVKYRGLIDGEKNLDYLR